MNKFTEAFFNFIQKKFSCPSFLIRYLVTVSLYCIPTFYTISKRKHVLMTFLAQLSLIFRLDSLIRRKATGSASQLAKRLDTSRSTVYRYLDILKALGAPIAYCTSRKSFYYMYTFELDLNQYNSFKLQSLMESC